MQFLDGCELILLGKEKLSRINGDPILQNNVVQTLALLSFWFSIGVVDLALGQVQWQGMQLMHALTMYMSCTDPEFFSQGMGYPRHFSNRYPPPPIRACVYIYNNTYFTICMYPFLIFRIRATLVLRNESLQFIYVFIDDHCLSI